MILPAIVLFGSLIGIIELVRPWSSEVPVRCLKIMSRCSIAISLCFMTLIAIQQTSAGNIFVRMSWSPIASGLLVGSLQLPLALSVGDSLGYSSAYCTLLAQPLNAAKLLRTRAFSYFQGFLSGLTNWWQVGLMYRQPCTLTCNTTAQAVVCRNASMQNKSINS